MDAFLSFPREKLEDYFDFLTGEWCLCIQLVTPLRITCYAMIRSGSPILSIGRVARLLQDAPEGVWPGEYDRHRVGAREAFMQLRFAIQSATHEHDACGPIHDDRGKDHVGLGGGLAVRGHP